MRTIRNLEYRVRYPLTVIYRRPNTNLRPLTTRVSVFRFAICRQAILITSMISPFRLATDRYPIAFRKSPVKFRAARNGPPCPEKDRSPPIQKGASIYTLLMCSLYITICSPRRPRRPRSPIVRRKLMRFPNPN